MRKFVVTTAFFLLIPAMSSAQSAEPGYAGQGYFFIGLGKGTPFGYSPLIVHVGGGGEGFLYKGVGLGAEVGYLSWAGRLSGSAWSATGDLSYHFGRNRRRGKLDPFVLGGIAAVGSAGSEAWGSGVSPAGNFGGGANLWISERSALRVEFRDIVGATELWDYRHYLSWRIGMTFR